MLLSELSIRKIIFSLLVERSAQIQSMNPYLPDKEKEFLKDDEDNANYVEAKEANIGKLLPKTKEFVARIKEYAKEKGYTPEPKVTSGFRGPRGQARVMFNNWKLHGGKNGGTDYLIGLYRDDVMAKLVGDSFTETNEYTKAIAILKARPISSHASGKAIDIRSIGHKHIGKIIHDVAIEFRNKGVEININDETGYKNPHWHVKVG
tara:strand:- start:12771 stop:13388 length:618 start_codon:yes stop_codon:yes gene_type:complete